MPDLSRIAQLRARLELPVTRRATGLLEGRHRSVLQGHGQDFDDLSLYSPGDDVGDIDWKSSARAGIPVIKRFVRQSNLALVLAVDTGRTMAATAASGETKSEVAATAASLVALIARDRGDRVALVAADAGRLTQVPARGGSTHLEVLLRHVERSFDLDAPAPDVGRLLDRATACVSRRALVVLVTDTEHPAPEHEPVLRRLRTRHELMVMSVADADPFADGPSGPDGPTRDVEDGWTLPPALRGRADLQAAVGRARQEREAAREALLRRLGVTDVVVRGSDDVVPALADLLRRSRRASR